MRCSKCGKEINYDSPLCIECVAALKVEAEESTAVESSVSETQSNAVNIDEDGTRVAETAVVLEGESFYSEDSEADAEDCFEANEEPFKTEYSYDEAANNIFSGDYSRGFNQGKKPNMIGFPRALIATIVAFFGNLAVSVTSIFYLGIYEFNFDVYTVSSLINGLVAFPTAVIGIVFGILSIMTFRRHKYYRPVATLVLGIAALSLGGSTLLSVLSMI